MSNTGKTIIIILTLILATLLQATPTKAYITTTPPPLTKQWETGDLGDWVLSVSWSPQGDKLAVGGDFSKVIVFTSNGKELWE